MYPATQIENSFDLDRVSDHVEMYVNHADLRKITYKFMFQYVLDCAKKKKST